jgi:signal transduction histidine kinase/DNA-binding response OmpR family regulator/streptogramin lyase
VGTGYGGLFKYDQDMNMVERYNHDPEDPNTLSYYFVYSLYEDNDGVLWIGGASNLDVLDKQNNRIIRCNLPEVMKYDYTRINDIYQDSHETLWVVATGGAYYLNKEHELDTSFQRAQLVDDPLMEIRCITEDSVGNIWLGSSMGKGLFLLTPKNRATMEFIHLMNDPSDSSSLGDNNVWSLQTDMVGNLWCGTSNGLYRYNSKDQTFTCYNEENGLNAKFIYNIKADKLGNLWLSTERGIVRFTQLTDSTAQSMLLEKEDGLPFEDNYQFKIYKDPQGMIYVGGRRYSGDGFYYFDPEQLKENEHIPPIVLTQLLIKNKPVQLDTSITEIDHLLLKHNQNYFSLEFAALDYKNPSKNSYTYKLDGFDENWIESGNRRLANYTNVPPGEYIFRVKGSNNDGIWNEEGTSVRITIASPPWKTWWAYTLYILFILAVIYTILRVYLNRQKILHNLELKHIEAEKLEELNREKSKFFANISHEFRTPLTLIIGPVKRAISQVKDKDIVNELKVSLNNSFRLQNLINQLLSLARLESGKVQLQAKEEDIVNLVRGYFQSFESAAREKDIELAFQAEPEEIQVYVDREKLEKILYNLISNALKFTSESGRIAVSVGQLDNWTVGQKVRFDQEKLSNWPTGQLANLLANYTIISISDTGSGIAPDHIDHIFDRFYQVDDSYTRDQEGTGIGLALVKELVELHHGSITVESEVGSGTTFRVYLPLGSEHLKEEEKRREGEEEMNFSQQSAVSSRQSELLSIGNDEMKSSIIHHPSSTIHESGPLLLIVEDNRDMRHYLRSCLEGTYRVEEAGDGESGLEKALELVPDLVISDVMMPKMDGYQLCDKIKSDERISHIPVILLTALTSLESKLEGLETGADDFLSKPFDASELQVRVKNLVEQRQKLAEKFMKNASQVGLSQLLDLPETGMTSMDEKFLQKTIEIIHQHLSEQEFNVDYLAEHMSMSRSQLYRKIHALTGMPPNEFIRYNRLQRAAELLKQHTGNIAEIAYEVGFNNPSYFSECFKKQFGVLPSDYVSNK